MSQEKISNEVIYELLKGQEARFTGQEKRIDDIREALHDMKHDQREDRRKLDAIYESRKEVSVNFTRAWAGASLGIAVFSSFASLLIFKIFIS